MSIRNFVTYSKTFVKPLSLGLMAFIVTSCGGDSDPDEQGGNNKPKPVVNDVSGVVDGVSFIKSDSSFVFEKNSDGINTVLVISASSLAKGDVVTLNNDLATRGNVKRLGGATNRLLYLNDPNKKIGLSIPNHAIAKSADGDFVRQADFTGTVMDDIYSKEPLNNIEDFLGVIENTQLTWKLSGNTLRKDGKDYIVGKATLPSM